MAIFSLLFLSFFYLHACYATLPSSIKTHDSLLSDVWNDDSKTVMGFFGAANNMINTSLVQMPDWLALYEYYWQYNASLDSFAPIPAEGPYNNLPIEHYRNTLSWIVEDGVGGPFDGPLGPVPDDDVSVFTDSFYSLDGTEISVKIYKPPRVHYIFGRYNTIVYFHGGCMTLCERPETYAGLLTKLAKQTMSIVVWVGYRLSPENVYPAAVEDAYQSVIWTRDNIYRYGGFYPGQINSFRGIQIAGDSAGGMLSLASALKLRDNGYGFVSRLYLFYPMLDWNFDKEAHPSLDVYGWCNTFPFIEYVIFRDMYFGNFTEDKLNEPYASPLRGSFHNLPRTSVYLAEFDMLRSEGEDLCHQLEIQGKLGDCYIIRGGTHPFLSNSGPGFNDFIQLRDWVFNNVFFDIYSWF